MVPNARGAERREQLSSAVSGLLVSYQIDTQPGPTIVMIAIAVFVVSSVTNGVLHMRTRQEAPHG